MPTFDSLNDSLLGSTFDSTFDVKSLIKFIDDNFVLISQFKGEELSIFFGNFKKMVKSFIQEDMKSVDFIGDMVEELRESLNKYSAEEATPEELNHKHLIRVYDKLDRLNMAEKKRQKQAEAADVSSERIAFVSGTLDEEHKPVVLKMCTTNPKEITKGGSFRTTLFNAVVTVKENDGVLTFTVIGITKDPFQMFTENRKTKVKTYYSEEYYRESVNRFCGNEPGSVVFNGIEYHNIAHKTGSKTKQWAAIEIDSNPDSESYSLKVTFV